MLLFGLAGSFNNHNRTHGQIWRGQLVLLKAYRKREVCYRAPPSRIGESQALLPAHEPYGQPTMGLFAVRKKELPGQWEQCDSRVAGMTQVS